MSLSLAGSGTLTGVTAIGDVSSTELGYLDGVTSALQTQINTKADASTQGLVLIDEETFSAVSSVSLNNVFSATYENYRIIITATNSGSATLLFRLRAAGTDTTSGYIVQTIFAYSTTSGANVPTSSGFVCYFGDIAEVSAAEMSIYQPNKASYTRQSGLSSAVDSASVTNLRVTGGVMRNATQYDGFTLIPSSGTITGTVRVYGYKGA